MKNEIRYENLPVIKSFLIPKKSLLKNEIEFFFTLRFSDRFKYFS